MRDVYGSNASLFPRICAVDAVGMGASKRDCADHGFDFLFELVPVVPTRKLRGCRPHVELEIPGKPVTLRTIRTTLRRARARAGLKRRIVYGLKDVHSWCALLHYRTPNHRAETYPRALHTNPDRTVTHIRSSRAFSWVVVPIDHSIEVFRHHFGDVV